MLFPARISPNGQSRRHAATHATSVAAALPAACDAKRPSREPARPRSTGRRPAATTVEGASANNRVPRTRRALLHRAPDTPDDEPQNDHASDQLDAPKPVHVVRFKRLTQRDPPVLERTGSRCAGKWPAGIVIRLLPANKVTAPPCLVAIALGCVTMPHKHEAGGRPARRLPDAPTTLWRQGSPTSCHAWSHSSCWSPLSW